MYTPAQLEGGRLHWLLDITLAGRIFRFSDAYVEVTAADGTVYAYEGQLPADLTVERELTGVGRLPAPQSVSLEVLLPVDLAQIVAQGHSIASGRGELSLWLEGETYESRQILIAGLLDDSPTYGEQEEPFAFTLTEEPFDDTALTHSATERVTADTWANAATNALGEWYPKVYGRPGYIRTASGGLLYRPGSPAPLIVGSSTADKVLLAGHRTVAGATGATVNLYNASDELFYDATATHETDGLGRVVTTASITGASTNFRNTNAQFWCAWKGAGAYRRERDKSATMDGVGEVITWLMGLSSLDLDVGTFRALEDELNSFVVGGYIDEPVSPWKYVQDNFLNLLPLALVSRGGRLTPVLLQPWRPINRAVASLTEGQEISRTSMATVDAGDHINEVSLSYSFNADSGQYLRQVILTPDYDSSDRDQTTGPYPRAGDARFGLRPFAETTEVVYDRATAVAIAHNLLRARWTPPKVVEYASTSALAYLQEGSDVSLTDAGLHFTDRVATLTRISYGLSVMGLEVRIGEDIVRDSIEI